MASPLLARILDTPQLARVVPQLHPEMLHRVIQHCGLEDASALVGLATAEQLRGVFDLDLWRSPTPGLDEQFDPDRFGLWLEVLMELGASTAAAKLAELDAALIIVGLSQHLLVFDSAAVAPYVTTDGEEIAVFRLREDQLTCEIGGYLVVPRRTHAWDAIVDLLATLDAEQPDCFHRTMAGCRGLSNSGRELDGLDELLETSDQAMFDVAFDRERRREQQGYATPAQAGAFLQMARQIRLDAASAPPPNPLAIAYQRALDADAAEGVEAPEDDTPTPPPAATRDDESVDVAAMVDILVGSGVIPERPRALLEGERDTRLARVQAALHSAAARDGREFFAWNEALAYLANVILSACSLQARPFTTQEASDAVLAICNLGLENWPAGWTPAERKRDRPDPDPVTVFQVGWSVLHQQVCVRSAAALVRALRTFRCPDAEIQAELDVLRREMNRCLREDAPWRVGDAIDVLSSIDLPVWAAMIGLTAECPVIHAGMDTRGLLRVNPNDFSFISENRQIDAVAAFLETLSERLGP